VIRDERAESREPEKRELIQNTPLVGDSLWHDDIERREAVCRNDQEIRADLVNVTDLSPAKEWQVERSVKQRVPHGRGSYVAAVAGET